MFAYISTISGISASLLTLVPHSFVSVHLLISPSATQAFFENISYRPALLAKKQIQKYKKQKPFTFCHYKKSLYFTFHLSLRYRF